MRENAECFIKKKKKGRPTVGTLGRRRAKYLSHRRDAQLAVAVTTPMTDSEKDGRGETRDARQERENREREM